MNQLKVRTRSFVSTMLSALLLLLVCTNAAWADPLLVRVQPNGDSFATSYVITGESRTYFGSVEGGTAPYEYRWEFTDGAGDTGFSSVGNPRYISYDGKVFDSAGTKFARLTVRDSSAQQQTVSATINLNVLVAAEDNLVRQKNSAIDRALRYLYLQEQPGGQGSVWPGSGSPIGSTGMALIALENHGHKLNSPDSDIYKKSVKEGIRYLLNNANRSQLGDSPCSGNPETGDGDSNNDGYGVSFTSDTYQNSLAVLALLNSTDKASAQSTVAQTGNSVNGMTYFDIAVDAKDFLVWAQNEGMGNGGGISLYNYSSPYYIDGTFSGSDITTLYGYVYSPNLSSLGCGGSYTIAWGDGSSTQTGETGTYCPYYYNDGYAMFGAGWGGANVSHHYTANGTYSLTISYTDKAGHSVTFPMHPTVNVAGTAACSGNFSAGRGGWRYTPNSNDSDNSATQWPVLALSEAANSTTGWGITANPKVKDELSGWLAYSQNANGGFGYTGGNDWLNFPKTAAGAIMLKYVGRPITDTAVQNSFSFLNGNWSVQGSDGNLGNFYGMYGFYKAMKLWQVDSFQGRAWEEDYTKQLINTQQSGNYWFDNGWVDQNFATYTALAILAPEVASLPPVANAGGPYPLVNPLQTVTLNGGASYHFDPKKSIVKWEWDFNADDGLWWDTKATPAAGEGAVGMTANASYPDTGASASYKVTLRVTDNTTPAPLTDTDTATINVTSGNVPPVAVTNGPWSSLPGNAVIFDATASYDPNACAPGSDPKCLNDAIVYYMWDLDGDGIFNEPGDDGTPVTPGDYRVVSKVFNAPVSLSATLWVKDKYGEIGKSSAAFNVISIALVYGQKYEICYKTPLNRYQERQGIQVKFKNFGNSTADNLKMTLTQLPTNLTVSNNRSFSILGSLASGQEKATACDPLAKTSDIELIFDRRVVPANDWRWRGEFDVDNSHFTVDNIPALAP